MGVVRKRTAKEQRKRYEKRLRIREREYPGWAKKCPQTCQCDCHDPDLDFLHDHPGRPCPGKAPDAQKAAS